MKISIRHLCCAATLLSCSGLAVAQVPEFTVKTKGGLAIESKDKAYAFKFGGRIQMDYNNVGGVMNADSDGERGSDLFFRRSRLVASGTIASDWDFKAEFNINEADGGDITDVYIAYTGFGDQANITAGHQREPFGLQTMTSSKNITFIERATPMNAFDAGRNMGVKLSGHGDNWTYAAGLFEVAQDDNDDIEFAYTGRFTFLPVDSDETLVHIGAGVRISEGNFDEVDARPGIRDVDGSDRISSGDLNADGLSVFNLEAAAVFGAGHLSAEYFSADVDGAGGTSDSNYNGFYLQGGWFLTGEQRPYKKSDGAFDKVTPSGDGGAWELIARFSTLDLQDNDIGNAGDIISVGVNWYANAYVRAGLNIVQADYDNAINDEDSGTGIAGRLQLVF